MCVIVSIPDLCTFHKSYKGFGNNGVDCDNFQDILFTIFNG